MANTFYPAVPILQQLFADKDSAKLLTAGTVTFYRDADRTTLKTIYTISGSPGNYIYVPIANPVALNLAGAFNQQIFLYPYDAEGNPDQYYIQVTNSNAVNQFNLEAIPDIGDINITTNAVTNYIIDGQFASRNGGSNAAVKDTISYLAEQFSLLRNAGSSSVDQWSFGRMPYAAIPPSNPYNYLALSCVTPNPADTVKTVRIKFPNVNLFASAAGVITFGFNAISLSGSALNGVTLWVTKNFGTGGSAPSTTQVGTFNIDTEWGEFFTSFGVGENIGTSIGTQGDDYIAFDLVFPSTIAFSVRSTLFLICDNEVISPAFPQSDVRIIQNFPKIGDMKLGSGSSTFEPNWVLADGRTLSRTTYGELFSLYCSRYSGNTTNGQPQITGLSTTANFFVGQQLTSANFAGIRRIVSIDNGTQITVDGNATTTSNDPAIVFTLYGAGDGGTTFQIPNTPGGFIMSAGPGSGYVPGQFGGSSTATLVLGSLTPHTHGYDRPTNSGGVAAGTGAGVVATTTGSTGGGAPFSILNPYTALNYYVRLI